MVRSIEAKEGGVRIHARARRAGEVDVVDLVVERCGRAVRMRTAVPLPRRYVSSWEDAAASEPFSLPVCRVREDTRRVVVPAGREVLVRLDDGPDGTLRVSLAGPIEAPVDGPGGGLPGR